ncbi:ATP-binding protein [Celeribacter litoreus]|uniref:ATP-binding protein n=1 Tax=Celeribacter litoreus TaxID=2876714 RepID=UPI001CCD2794|nr:AAA family ATPase [Celeribacter litoreus]MCA0043460.1 AAA family ATPase [Celeribacter litoreus]
MPIAGENVQTVVLRAELFGHLRVSDDGRDIALPASKKTRGLLGYLLSSERAQSRSELCDLLWEDAEDPRAALRWSLSKIRTALGPERLVADRNTVALRRDMIATDVAMVEAVSNQFDSAPTDELMRTQALLRGEFLNGLDLPQCYGFHEWCQAERSRLGRLHEQLLTTLLSRTRHDPQQALEFAHKLVGLNPFDEAAHIRVIELQLALGRAADAAAQAAQCRKIFRTELGIEPSSALDQACRAPVTIRPATPKGREVSAAPSKRAAPTGFVGRQEELALIRDALEREPAEIVLIVGAPGIGKSALLSEVGRQSGALRLSARAVEVERLRPLGLWRDALRALSMDDIDPTLRDALRDLLANRVETATVRSEEQHFEPFRAFLSALAATGPVLVTLDDLQWMEPSSCALLSYLIRNLKTAPVRFCLSARAGEIDDNDAVQSLLSGLGDRIRRLSLTGLSMDDALTLARSLQMTGEVEECVRRAQGNPLYLRVLSQRDAVLTTSASLDEALSNRIERLSQPAINLASWASVFGRSIPMEQAVEASGLEVSTALDLIEELERHEITRSLDGGTCEFTHDLIRDATYERLSHSRRRLMHGRIADLLARDMETAPDQSVQVMHHAAMSDRHELAARAAVLAGDHALRALANAEAAEIALKGLFHAGKLGPGPARISLLIQLYRCRVLALSGSSTEKFPKLVAELETQISLASQHAMAPEVAEGEYLLSVLYQELGDLEAASRATARAASAASRMKAQKRVRQLANSARCLLELGRDVPKAEELCRDARAFAEEEGIADVEVIWSQGLLAYWQGDLAKAADKLDTALALARDNEDRWRECKCLTWAAMIALERDLPPSAIAFAEDLRTLADKIGEGAMAPLAETFLALAHDDSEALDVALISLERADDKFHLAYALNLAAEKEARQGNRSRAVELATRAYAVADAIDNSNERALAQAQAHLLGETVGDPKAVLEWPSDASSPAFTARVRHILSRAARHDS